MSKPDPTEEAILAELGGEIAARLEAGEDVSLGPYEAQHPERAARLRAAWPALAGPAGVGGAALGVADRRIGDYRIIREVGRGGMGVVYEAEQVSLGRQVALKVLPCQITHDPTLAERFRSEARAAAGLHHPNIVPVYEVGQDGEIWYYAMQFIDGQGLDLVIKELKQSRRHPGPRSGSGSARARRSPHPAARAVMQDRAAGWKATGPRGREASADSSVELPPPASGDLAARSIVVGLAHGPEPEPSGGPTGSDGGASPGSDSERVLSDGSQLSGAHSLQMHYYRRIARIAHGVAEGLAYAHGRGVIHRDIKPANLLLDSAGAIWITDFGLAKAGEENLTVSGDIIGTVRYMAPERFRGEGDGRVDTYALGLTLYELATLREAFDSFDRLHLIDQIRHNEPVRPRSIEPKIPRDLETIILKAIEKEPGNRYRSAADLAEDLRCFLNGEPIRARQVGELERVWKWMRRRPAIAALLVLSLALLVVGATTSTILALRARESAALAGERARLATREEGRARDAEFAARRLAAESRTAGALASAAGGEVDIGVFGLIEALELTPDLTDGDRAQRRTLLRNLAAWTARLPVLRATYELDESSRPVAGREAAPQRIQFTGAAHRQLNLIAGDRIRRFDLVTGMPLGDPAGRRFPGAVHHLSEDGTLVVAAAQPEGTPAGTFDVSLFEHDTGRLVRQLPRLKNVRLDTFALISPDNRYVGLLVHPPADGSPGDDSTPGWRFWRIDDGAPAGPPNPVGDVERRPVARFLRDESGRVVLVYAAKSPSFFGGLPDRLLFWDMAGSPLESIRPAPVQPVLRSGQVESTCDLGFDGQSLVLALNYGLVRWYDPATGKTAGRDWRLNRTGLTARLLEDARTLAINCDDGRVRWYNLTEGRECGSAPQLRGRNQAIAPSGTLLLASRGDRLAVWQVPLDLNPMQTDDLGSGRPLFAAASYAAAGQRVAAGDSRANDSSMGRQDLTKFIKSTHAGYGGKPLGVMGIPGGPPIGLPTHPLDCHPSLSADARLIAACRTQTGSEDRLARPIVGVWEVDTGRVVLPWLAMPQHIHALSLAPDGRSLAVGLVAGAVLIDLTGKRRSEFLTQAGPISRVEWSDDGTRFALGSRSGWGYTTPGVRLWDRLTWKPIGPILPAEQLPFFEFIPASRDLRVFDRNKRQIVRLDGATGTPQGGPTTLQLARSAAGGDRATDEAKAIGFRPDGSGIAEAVGSTAHQYDARTGRVFGPPLKHSALVYWLVYSADGSTLASLSTDGSVRLWDAPTGQLLGPALELGAPCLGLTFSADGATLATVTVDGRVISCPVPRGFATDDPARLRLLAESMTALRQGQGDGDEFIDLDMAEWRQGRTTLASTWPEVVPGADLREGLMRWYEDRAHDAQRRRNPADQRRNIERLIDLRPNDWHEWARLADLNIEAGRLDEGEAGYSAVRAQAPAPELTLWCWQRGVEHLAVGHPAASWYLDRVVAARPKDWRPHAHRAEALAKLGRADASLADVARALELDPDPSYATDLLADRVQQRDWSGAARLATLAPIGKRLNLTDRVLLDLAGENAATDPATLDRLLQSASNSKPLERLSALNLATLGPLDPGRSSELLGEVTALLKGIEPATDRSDQAIVLRHDAHQMAAALHVRSGHLAEALGELDRARAEGRVDPDDSYWSALIAARQGQPARALVLLEAARTQAQKDAATLPWQQILIYHLRESEIRRAIDAERPRPDRSGEAVARGPDQEMPVARRLADFRSALRDYWRSLMAPARGPR